MQKNQCVAVLSFGGQHSQLIARRVRETQVYSKVLPYHIDLEALRALDPIGIVLAGGPESVLADSAPKADPGILSLGVPVLAMDYGMQWMTQALGGQVAAQRCAQERQETLRIRTDKNLFQGMGDASVHVRPTHAVIQVPAGFEILASTDSLPVAAMAQQERSLYGVQFHPEVTGSQVGRQVFENFLSKICGAAQDWTAQAYIDHSIESIRAQVGDKQVLLGLSGGVDSSVCAALISKAIGKQLNCVYVNHGLMRKNESQQVQQVFTRHFPVNLVCVDASQRFFDRLAGVADPEQKRKIIGATFIDVFAEEAEKLGNVDFLAQGTIYPDILESGAEIGTEVIKSHHNVGGLPDNLVFTGLVEPLDMLFKDEVRAVGAALGLPQDMVWRQPFPGPGLGVRVLGEVTPDKVEIVRESDAVLRDEIEKAGLAQSIQQYFTVLPGIRSVGVKNGLRSYDYTIGIRAINTDDFMTVDWARIPLEVLARISERIVTEVEHVNRVVYDITTKPPASIEWE